MPPLAKRPVPEPTKQQKVAYVKGQGQIRNHHCHWPGCTKQVPPAMWGCYSHWMKLPKYLRDKIWAAYRPGQEVTATPSRDYVVVAREVKLWILANHPPADQKGACLACGGTGKNTKGGPCEPCQALAAFKRIERKLRNDSQ